MTPQLPIPLSKEMFGSLLADLPDDVFDTTFVDACERFDRFVGALSCEVARNLGLPQKEPIALDALMGQRSWLKGSQPTLRWLFSTLQLFGYAQRCGEEWVITDLPHSPAASEVRAAALAANPAVAPAYEVLAVAAAALPGVLSGSLKGEDALFGPQTTGLWFSYFSNDNPLYAPSNRVTAVAAARAAGASPKILELGGGGSAAQELSRRLQAAGKTPQLYHFTELHPAFLRRGARVAQGALPPDTAFRAFRFDINLSPAAQDVTPGYYDLIVAVNTIHLARDLVATLKMLKSLLAEGGVLVLGELIRPAGTGTVHLELPFSLLSSYRETAGCDGSLRPPGFLGEAIWRDALHTAGFSRVELLPALLTACTAIYPGFYAGAFVAS